VGPTFQFYVLPHWKFEQDYGGWPRRSIFKGKSSSLGGCGVNFYANMCKVEKIVDAKITEMHHINFFSMRRMNFECKKCWQKFILKKVAF